MTELSSPIQLLNPEHDLSTFDCGVLALNQFLQKYALINQQTGSARTYVLATDERVIGYYTLTVGSVSLEEATPRARKGMPRYPIPIGLIARLAIDISEHRKGLGAALLKDAILKLMQAAEIVGIRAIVVHAKDRSAKSFYEKYGFEASPIDELHLYLLVKDVPR